MAAQRKHRKFEISQRNALIILSVAILLLDVVATLLFGARTASSLDKTILRKRLQTSYEEICRDPTASSDTMISIEKNNVNVLIVDGKTLEIVYSTNIGGVYFHGGRSDVFREVNLRLQTDGALPYYGADNDRRLSGRTEGEEVGKTYYLRGFENGRYVEVSILAQSLSDSLQVMYLVVILVGVTIWLLTMCLIFLISRYLSKPLADLRETASHLARMDFSRQCSQSINKDTNRLSDEVNSMAVQLQKSICDLKSSNEKLSIEIEERKRAERANRELIANISHDLKTPIALISGYTEGLTSGMVKTPEQEAEYYGIIADETEYMQRLIARMLELCRIESGCYVPERINFSISGMLDELIGRFQVTLYQADIELELAYADDIIVYADPQLVERVLTNYVQNAVHHNNKKRRIRISVKTSDMAEVIVYNTCDPFDPEKIWDRFYRDESARTRKNGEIGLGLAIVKGSMEQMQLPYGMRQTEEGVEFWIGIPLGTDQNESNSFVE